MTEPSEPSPRRGVWLRGAAWTLAAIAVTALSLRLLLTDETVGALRSLLPRVSFAVLLLALPLGFGVNLARGARFRMALGTRGPGSATDMFRIVATLTLLNLILPFKLGEVSFPLLAKRTFGTSYATAAGALLYARVTDALTLTALGGLIVTAIGQAPGSPVQRTALPIGVTALALLALLPVVVTRAHALGRSWTRSPRLLAFMDRLFEGCRGVASPRRHAAYLALSLSVWGMVATCGVVTMAAMGAPCGLLPAIVACAGASLTFALPVSGVAAVGPMQASWAYGLTLVGWEWDVAVANAFLFHATMLVVSAALALVALLAGRTRARGPLTG